MPWCTKRSARGPLFALHVTLNILGVFGFRARVHPEHNFLLQNRLLRGRKVGGVFWRFPALDILDRMSRSAVIVGFCAGGWA